MLISFKLNKINGETNIYNIFFQLQNHITYQQMNIHKSLHNEIGTLRSAIEDYGQKVEKENQKLNYSNLCAQFGIPEFLTNKNNMSSFERETIDNTGKSSSKKPKEEVLFIPGNNKQENDLRDDVFW